MVQLDGNAVCRSEICRDHAWFIGFSPVENPEIAAATPTFAAQALNRQESLAIGTCASISTRLRPGRMAPRGSGIGFFVNTSPADLGSLRLTAFRPFTLTTMCASVVSPGAYPPARSTIALP